MGSTLVSGANDPWCRPVATARLGLTPAGEYHISVNEDGAGKRISHCQARITPASACRGSMAVGVSVRRGRGGEATPSKRVWSKGFFGGTIFVGSGRILRCFRRRARLALAARFGFRCVNEPPLVSVLYLARAALERFRSRIVLLQPYFSPCEAWTCATARGGWRWRFSADNRWLGLWY